jgi:uncharacterized protein (TIGR02001 family)
MFSHSRNSAGYSVGAAIIGAFSVSAMLGAPAALAADPAAPKTIPDSAASESKPIDFAFGFRLASDYNFRGISQSNRDPSPQAYGELQLFDNLIYAGVAGYRVDLATRPGAEIDLTAGFRPKWGPLSFDLGVIYYYYPGERRLVDAAAGTIFTPANTDFLELAGKVSWAIDSQWTLGAGVFHAWDWLGSGAPATYANLTAKYTLPDNLLGVIPSGFAVSGELGHYSLGTTAALYGSVRLPDYVYWNAGVSYSYKAATLDLRYHDTDLSKKDCFINTTDPKGVANGTGRSNWCGAAFIATLSFDTTASQLGIFATLR